MGDLNPRANTQDAAPHAAAQSLQCVCKRGGGGGGRVEEAEVKEAKRGCDAAAFGCSLSVSSHKGEVFDAREPDFSFVF